MYIYRYIYLCMLLLGWSRAHGYTATTPCTRVRIHGNYTLHPHTHARAHTHTQKKYVGRAAVGKLTCQHFTPPFSIRSNVFLLIT